MLIRISLIIALVAALAVGVLNFVQVKTKIETLITERNDWHGKYDTTYAALTKTKQTLAKTEKDLKQTKDTLETTTTERDTARKEAEAQTKKATELAQKLSKTTAERDQAQQQLAAYKATGWTPEMILTADKTIKQTKDALEVANTEKKILQRELEKKTVELNKLVLPDYHVRLPASLKGKVLVVDPKWDFVVLNFGADKDVLLDGELLVSRDGRLVGKVRIQSIQKDRCIANVMPGWKLGEIMEGDQVIPAYPKSS
jgi:hypothetical protein